MNADSLVPFNDISIQWNQIRDNALPDLIELFDNSAYCLGPWVESFEMNCASYLNIKHAVAVNSGTSALHLACIVAGIGPGDKVMMPAQTFIGTAWGVLYQGAFPILCDVDQDTATISIEELERRYEPGVKAIIPVHLFGQPADMTPILNFASKYKITVIEDAAQAFGACYNGKKISSIGDLGCMSFYPGKNLGSAGEAGLISTNNDEIASRLKALRNHAQLERYAHHEMGFNYRMTGIQGLILQHKLKYLDDWTAARKKIAMRYNTELQGLPCTLAKIKHDDHVWHLYVIRTKLRDKLRHYLSENGVETGLHYPIPLHKQPVMSRYGVNEFEFPNAEQWANESLSLPIFPGMTEVQQNKVIDALKKFFK